MNSIDSVVKIMTQYFPAVTKKPFTYKGKVYNPKELRVSPGLFTRRMTCVPNCGGCCRAFTMDWLPGEEIHDKVDPIFEERTVEFDGKEVMLWSDMQRNNETYYCHHLNLQDGRCGIHDRRALSCDFELIRFTLMGPPERANQVTHRPFGRGWAMRRIDGERGALCHETWRDEEPDQEWIDDVVRKFLRLKDWTDHFGLETVIPEIVDWLRSGPHKDPLIVNKGATFVMPEGSFGGELDEFSPGANNG